MPVGPTSVQTSLAQNPASALDNSSRTVFGNTSFTTWGNASSSGTASLVAPSSASSIPSSSQPQTMGPGGTTPANIVPAAAPAPVAGLNPLLIYGAIGLGLLGLLIVGSVVIYKS